MNHAWHDSLHATFQIQLLSFYLLFFYCFALKKKRISVLNTKPLTLLNMLVFGQQVTNSFMLMNSLSK